MYPYVLIAHNTWRWVVLGLGMLLLISVVRGLREQTPWGTGVALKARLFAIAVDLQLLGGVALYLVLSPLTTMARSNADSLQTASEQQFVGLAHGLVMVAAIALVHVAAVLVRKAGNDVTRHRLALGLYGPALLIIIAGTPWWRPLLRLWLPGV
jgi:hypothetical protein